MIDLYRLYFIHKKIIKGGDELSSPKKGGGLLEGGELFERGGLNRGFGVIHKFCVFF